MANPVTRGFRNLTRFSGRDTRGQFWPYAGVVFALTMVVMMASMAWMMSDVFADMQAFAMEHPEAATVTAGPGSYSISVEAGHPEAPLPDFTRFFLGMKIGILAAVALFGAAVSRRLHDRNKSALWGLMPVPFLVFASFAFPIMMADFMKTETPDLRLFFAIFANNMLYLIALASLIIMLILPGTPGPNRFGEEGQP